MSFPLRALPVTALVVFALGCAGGSNPTPATPATPAAQPGPALPVKIRAATSGVFQPFSDWKDGRPAGFAPMLVESFARSAHVPVEWSQFRWSELRSDMGSGRFDVASDGITVAPHRSILGRFTVPIARGAAVLLLRRPPWAPSRGDGPSAPRDLVRAIDKPELRVMVNAGGHLESVTRDLFHIASVRPTSDQDALRQALATGEADAVMTDTFKVLAKAKETEGLERIGPLAPQTMALWVRADQPLLAERLDEWLIEEEQSGRLAAMRSSVLGPGGGADTAGPVEAILSATAELLSLMPYVAAAKKHEGRPTTPAAEDPDALAAGPEAVARAAARSGISAPPRPLVDAFFQAERDAARMVEATPPPLPASEPDTYSYERQLAPALGRITEKLALLVVKLPSTVSRDDVQEQARAHLSDTGLDGEAIDRLASVIVALGQP
jgi:cyclohexadienyl dehydratase